MIINYVKYIELEASCYIVSEISYSYENMLSAFLYPNFG